MKGTPLFFNLYENISAKRLLIIGVLLALGAGILFYFNQLGKALEDRELKYANLYAQSINFFVSKNPESDCDYTFVQEVLDANETIPIVVTIDDQLISSINIPELTDSTNTFSPAEKETFLANLIIEMEQNHEPLKFNLAEGEMLVYFSNSSVVNQLKYFPLSLIATFLIFGSLAFVAYSSSRRAEENKVWVGLAKETAHQLGTPISALVAWVEVLRTSPGFDQSVGDDMVKDLDRLDTITRRFSNIGSVPSLKPESIGSLVFETMEYLKKRISTKIEWSFDNQLTDETKININKQLFEWVIENLCKNAVDAMSGTGTLDLTISKFSYNKIAIDIKDNGKGIKGADLRKIFKPGYSSKKRGWGLGLTLAKRIIEVYHNGALQVLETTVNQGTTFRILLRTDLE